MVAWLDFVWFVERELVQPWSWCGAMDFHHQQVGIGTASPGTNFVLEALGKSTVRNEDIN